jgi:quercetin dioxygenase-like cupin family protein
MGKLVVSTFAAVVMMLATTAAITASDADAIDDFCVADLTSTIILNGLVCRNPATVNGTDFAFTGFEKAGNTDNSLGSVVTPGFAGVNYPALNTLGLALARIDYAKGGGLVPPHTHPRATEVLYVVKGTLYVGFVDTNDKLYSAVLHKGDVFVFPKGLLHFQLNIGHAPAFSISVLNSQNPGVQLTANALFGAQPPIQDNVLAKAFGIPVSEVQTIKKGFGA